MRITFVINSISNGAGGAERVMTIMANYWVVKGWEVTLLTFDDGKEPPFFKLDDRVKYIPLGLNVISSNFFQGILNNFMRLFALRKALIKSKPQAVISFMDNTNILTLIASRFLNVPVIVSERTNPAMSTIGMYWESLRKLVYSWATFLVVQSEDAKNFFSEFMKKKTRVIPNPVIKIDKYSNDKIVAIDKPTVIAMGRLLEVKGFDVLLEAFAKVNVMFPDWSLTILGEGPLRKTLEGLKEDLGLADKVKFLGEVKNPQDYLKQADVFVLTSRFEGFPNALCEAMACGLPVISTDCPSGPRDIIRDGVDGILVDVDDVDGLADAMHKLLSDESLRLRFSAKAQEITDRFSLENVMNMWEKLVESQGEK